jgi:electron transfer flavoprotein beta subunit
MRIIVCAKQVPDSDKVRIDPKTGSLMRESALGILNHEDANALEEALKIKEKFPKTHITVLSMGPMQAKNMLQECLAMGADEAVLITDKKLAGADTFVTSDVLASAIKKLGDFDLIFTGKQSYDGDTGQVGPQIAEKMGIPQITYASEIEISEAGTVKVKRVLNNGYERLEVKLPCLITATKELNEPRYMTVSGIWSACEKTVLVLGAGDVGFGGELNALDESPTNVLLTFAPKAKGKGITVQGDTNAEIASNLLEMLQGKINK